MPTFARFARVAGGLFVALAGTAPIPARGEPAGPATRGRDAVAAAVRPTTEDVAAVILQLGADDFAVRERAAARLAALGSSVADELLTAAETSADLEVALRARALVEGISPVSAGDPVEAAAELAKFVRAEADARGPIMHRLLRLDGDAGIEPLARIVRLDRTPSGSLTAAALIVQEWQPADPYWPQLRPRIAAGLAGSRRPAARFLRALVAATDPAAPHARTAAIEEATASLAILEQERHHDPGADGPAPARTPQESAALRLMRRGLVTLLIAADRKADAVREFDHLLQADRDRADDPQVEDAFTIDNLSWAVEQGLPEAVDLVEQRAAKGEEREPDPSVTYARAVAWRALGRAERAAALADEAAAAAGKAADPSNARYEAASSLSKWGAFEWADREFRAVIDDPATPAALVAVAGVVWSESLHDRLRHDEAAAVLRSLFDDRTKEFRHEVERMMRTIRNDPENIRARMAYFAACAAAARGDEAGRRRLLEQALRHAPGDVDSLIAVYRLAGTPAQKAEAAARVARAAGQLDERIGEAGQVEANDYNEYAWLVANTEGDVAKAIRYSRRSLELAPDSGSYLDTLAHCQGGGGGAGGAPGPPSRGRRPAPPPHQTPPTPPGPRARGGARRGARPPAHPDAGLPPRALQPDDPAQPRAVPRPGRGTAMTTHTLTVRDARLAVHTRGTGIPCVLLHGFPLDHSMWREQEPLAEHLRLIVPDLRGFGGSSDAVMESVESLADDVPALLDALHVGGPAVICGLSMGGYVAQHVAVRHPDRVAALVLVDTKLEADTPEARAARADLSAKVGRIGQGIVADAMVPRLFAPSTAAAPGRGKIEALLRSAILAQSIAGIQAALAALAARPDMTEPMAHVLAPTLLVCGAEDAITPPDCLERAEEIMPCARLLIVPGAGHMTPLEAPEVFNRAVLEFLRHPPGVGLPGLAGRD